MKKPEYVQVAGCFISTIVAGIGISACASSVAIACQVPMIVA